MKFSIGKTYNEEVECDIVPLEVTFCWVVPGSLTGKPNTMVKRTHTPS